MFLNEFWRVRSGRVTVYGANQEGGGSFMKRMEALTTRIEVIQAKAGVCAKKEL